MVAVLIVGASRLDLAGPNLYVFEWTGEFGNYPYARNPY